MGQKKKELEIKNKINENQLKKEKERLERKKRLERIMQRTRGKKTSNEEENKIPEVKTPEKVEHNSNGINHINHDSPTQNNENGHMVATTTGTLFRGLHSNDSNHLSNDPKLDETPKQIVNSTLVQ